MFIGVGVLLASYTWGTDALRFSGMTDEAVIEETLMGLAKIHNRPYSYIKQQYMNGHVKRWTLDPNTLGAFLALMPYQVGNRDLIHSWENSTLVTHYYSFFRT